MEKNLFQAMEQLNREKNEILCSKEYKLGAQIIRYGGNIIHLRFGALAKDIKDKWATSKIRKHYTVQKSDVDVSYAAQNRDDVRIAVYTCITGGYDSIQIPLVFFPNVDYYLLTDEPDKYLKCKDVYRICRLPQAIVEMGPVLANRYAKFHPHEFFAEYDYAIYLDGNIRVISDIRLFTQKCDCITGIAMHEHRERDCLYQEADVCQLLRRGDPQRIKEQIERYKKDSFPSGFGLSEATVIASDMRNHNSIVLLDSWWNEFYASQSLRDQLAWPYVLWKNGYTMNDVGNLGRNIYQNYKLEIVRHI